MLDKLDLKIISLLSVNCRISYRNISSIVDLTPNAVKIRVNKMISNGIIKDFIVRVNPYLFGYKKEYSLTIRNSSRKIKEEDIVNRLSLVGDLLVYAKQLGGSSICILALKSDAQDKIEVIKDLLKPAVIEKAIIANYRETPIQIKSSDLKIIKNLLMNPRMQVEDIAKYTSLSTKTVARWFERMKKNQILQFTIIRDMSSTQLIGYIEFALLINIDRSFFRGVYETISREMEEHLLFIPNLYQNNIIFAVLFCANIPTLDLILTRLQSYNGVQKIELFITTKLTFYQDWLKKEIDKRFKVSYDDPGAKL
jgi:DNA-binding Lrp family transcriptional regulator